MQITAPAPIIYLPENLWSLFSRPGRELLVRVIGIEGKTLSLELGGDRFQARIGGTLNPEDFRVGENIRIRVMKNEGPIILQVLSPRPSKISPELNLLYLITSFKTKPSGSEVELKEINLMVDFVRDLLWNIIRREKGEIRREKEEFFLGKDLKTLKILYEENKIILPFLFSDEKSWGYLELGLPEEIEHRVKIFSFRLFLEYLGLVEGILSYLDQKVFVDLYFYNSQALELAKKEFKELHQMFLAKDILAKINLEEKKLAPGYLLEKEG
ncbi:MAG: hypothetical protein NZ530_02130 [Thermodesulfobacteriaceae bacterium]|nr:hypothetical protein [Thermodesulfobacteriaceae bacterium]MDW8135860.1 hypothetical protein [Thermodesulfobacterium sp.]